MVWLPQTRCGGGALGVFNIWMVVLWDNMLRHKDNAAGISIYLQIKILSKIKGKWQLITNFPWSVVCEGVFGTAYYWKSHNLGWIWTRSIIYHRNAIAVISVFEKLTCSVFLQKAGTSLQAARDWKDLHARSPTYTKAMHTHMVHIMGQRHLTPPVVYLHTENEWCPDTGCCGFDKGCYFVKGLVKLVSKHIVSH